MSIKQVKYLNFRLSFESNSYFLFRFNPRSLRLFSIKIFILALALAGCTIEKSVNTLGATRIKAEQGHATAQNNLGVMYTKGSGVPQNDQEAIRWYRKAADQGYVIAQYNLGWMYDNGRGVPQNDQEAIRW